MVHNNNLEQIRRNWENAGLANDFVFNKVMLDKSITLEVLRRVLPELHINKIKRIANQQELVVSHDTKGVRLDIYVEDDQHNHFDIEMQVIDNHNLPERIRFYHSNLAMNCYEKGQNYATTDSSYVIFFCCFDPFGFGNQRYRIERMLREHPEYPYDDGEHTRVFDVTSLRKDVSPKLQQFLDVIANRKVEGNDDFIVKLKQRITFVKHNREWRREYMQRSLYEMDIENSINRAKSQGLEEGKAVGIAEGEARGKAAGIAEGEARGEAKGKAAEKQRGIKNLICSLADLGISSNIIKQKLMDLYHLSSTEADTYLKK